MATGLTSKIYQGTDMSLKSFALKCATQFREGYIASDYGDKELPLDKAPILKVDEYYFNNLEKAKKNVVYWKETVSKNPSLQKTLYEKYINDRNHENTESNKKQDEIKNRYLKMKSKIEAWDCSEEYKPLKDLMLKQISESIDHDCTSSVPYSSPIPTKEEWLSSQIECACRSEKFAKDSLEEAKKQVSEVNEYISGLYISLDKAEGRNCDDK